MPKVKKREYFEFAWAHWALKVIDSNGSHIGEGRIAYALHSVQTVYNIQFSHNYLNPKPRVGKIPNLSNP